ncbi:MAG: hypothetical protein AzoDbin1_04610 [Azoarcus sp.]|nr:hypothetical protein [Azoarcus sp.]
MIEHAASENLNIRTAVARLAKANARLGLAEAERRPTVNAQADAAREPTPGAMLPFNPSVASGNTTTTLSGAGFPSRGIDLWGRLARGREAASAELDQGPNALMGELNFGKGSIEGIAVPVLDMDDLPASLIERRPDIRAAKAALMAPTTLFKALGGGWSREP